MDVKEVRMNVMQIVKPVEMLVLVFMCVRASACVLVYTRGWFR